MGVTKEFANIHEYLEAHSPLRLVGWNASPQVEGMMFFFVVEHADDHRACWVLDSNENWWMVPWEVSPTLKAKLRGKNPYGFDWAFMPGPPVSKEELFQWLLENPPPPIGQLYDKTQDYARWQIGYEQRKASSNF